MRIRKRKVPFPISSLSPVPLSDPQFSEQLQLQSKPNENFTEKDNKVSNFAASDQPNHPIGESSKKEGKEDQKEREKKSNDDSRKGHFVGSKMAYFLEDKHNDNNNNVQENKFNKRRSSGEDNKKTGAKNKKIGRGGAVMEGSRCSRVNGRGWRCCQPTLVGYSLCEHHLGKGRLRSMSSVRNQSITFSTTVEAEERKDILSDHEEDEKQQPLLVSKKKQKLGRVKARSISSLLGQVKNNNNNNAEVAESIEE